MYEPQGTGQWQLYNLEHDLAEQQDLAKTHPDKLEELISLWLDYAAENNVVIPNWNSVTRALVPEPRRAQLHVPHLPTSGSPLIRHGRKQSVHGAPGECPPAADCHLCQRKIRAA